MRQIVLEGPTKINAILLRKFAVIADRILITIIGKVRAAYKVVRDSWQLRRRPEPSNELRLWNDPVLGDDISSEGLALARSWIQCQGIVDDG